MGMFFFLLACSTASDSSDTGQNPACNTAPAVTYENWGQGFFLTYCGACHSRSTANRNGAPEGVDFDNRSDIIKWKDRIQVRVLDEQSMPLGGGVYTDELELLQVLMACDF